MIGKFNDKIGKVAKIGQSLSKNLKKFLKDVEFVDQNAQNLSLDLWYILEHLKMNCILSKNASFNKITFSFD